MRTIHHYEIRVASHFASSWVDWFEGLEIHHDENGETVLVGPVLDQAELLGILSKVHDLNLQLISVRQIAPH